MSSVLTASTPILLVGGGKMGTALLTGWLARGMAVARVSVIDPSPEVASSFRQSHQGLKVHDSLDDVPAPLAAALAGKGTTDDHGSPPPVIVFATKPQIMEKVIPLYRDFAGGAVFLSIAAGRDLGFFAAHLGEQAAVVRAMPNTPAAIGQGMTVAVANAWVETAGRDLCGALLAAVGDVAWIEDEALMDAVTAVSGSGPAYVFWMVECLAAAGEAAGLPAELALRLARQTVAGSGALLEKGEKPGELRRNVTSPGGTTEAALAVLMAENGLKPLMEKAVEAAARRSRELAKS